VGETKVSLAKADHLSGSKSPQSELNSKDEKPLSAEKRTLQVS
jgi:hypothetical protein